MTSFNDSQIDIFIELFIDLAKAMFISSFAVPFFIDGATIITSIRNSIIGVLLVFYAVELQKNKEKSR